jgi:hypothetical protein
MKYYISAYAIRIRAYWFSMSRLVGNPSYIYIVLRMNYFFEFLERALNCHQLLHSSLFKYLNSMLYCMLYWSLAAIGDF